jgi:hypothetical protein
MFRAAYLRNNELMNRGDVETALDWIPARLNGTCSPMPCPDKIGLKRLPCWADASRRLDSSERWPRNGTGGPSPRSSLIPGDGTILVHASEVLRRPATGLGGRVRFTQVWHFDEDGMPAAVRERLDEHHLLDPIRQKEPRPTTSRAGPSEQR